MKIYSRILSALSVLFATNSVIPHLSLLRAYADDAVSDEMNNLEFSLDLYGHLKAKPNENFVISPYSIEQALGVALLGARGTTAAQMVDALKLQQAEGDPRLSQLTPVLKQAEKDEDIEFRLANGIWMEQSHAFLAGYLALARSHFDVELKVANFAEAAESVRKEINAWVSRVTAEMIPELLTAGTVSPETRVVLVNALYFKAKWETPFRASATKPGDFWVSDAKKNSVPFLTQSESHAYAENDELQALELPYRGEYLSMVVVLPRSRVGLAQAESNLTAKSLSALIHSLTPTEVNVKLPKFKVASNELLQGALAKLGMVDAFEPSKADFSGIDGTKLLYISAIIHSAVVEADEEGTKAAAATAVGMVGSAAPVARKTVDFIADHPFLFLIRDRRFGNILFMGRVALP